MMFLAARVSSLTLKTTTTRRASVEKSIMRRPIITSYLKDVWHSQSLVPQNPMLQNIQQALRIDKNDDNNVPPRLDFTYVHPHHASKAASELVKAREDQLSELLATTTTTAASTTTTNTSSSTTSSNAATSSLDDFLTQWDRIQAPIHTLQCMTYLQWLVSDDASKQQWQQSLDYVCRMEQHDYDLNTDDVVDHPLVAALQSLLDKDHDNCSNEARRVATYWLDKYAPDRELDDATARGKFQQVTAALSQVTSHLVRSSTSSVSPKEFMTNLYNFVALQQKQAHLLGYLNTAQRVLAKRRTANIDQIQTLHQAIVDRVVVCQLKDDSSKDEIELQEYLSPTGPTQRRRQGDLDKQAMLRLERHVTLNGALAFGSQLCRDLFGLDLVQDDDALAWNKDIRLFHAYDATTTTTTYVGSFYLDPFQRNGKLPRNVTLPLVARCGDTDVAPIVCMSLQLEPPTWDTDQAMMRWEDVESLLHELGHVVDLLLLKSKMGTIAGPESYPFDRSEVASKFMEYCMMDKSTVHALMDLSSQTRRHDDDNDDVSDESIQAAFRVRSRRKALELAQHAFVGALELELFSTFDLKESVLDLQQHLAKKMMPHDMPDKTHISCLVDIMDANAHGHEIGWYRYLWCDAISAKIFQQYQTLQANNSNMTQSELQQWVRRRVLLPSNDDLIDDVLDGSDPSAILKRYNLE